ncbi:MAG: DNA-processing protein DprA [Pseudomonadota bacterium]
MTQASLTLPVAEPPDDLKSWLRLARSPRVGTATFRMLVERYGSAREALRALPDHAARGGGRGYAAAPLDRVERELELADRFGAVPIRLGTPDYPAALAQVADAPPLLWARGRRDLLHRSTVALVGARNASALGLRMAEMLSSGLSTAGQVIASGLARGVDRAAHLAALDGGTVAVLAGGIDHLYPQQNADIYGRIGEDGVLLSEAPMGLQPLARHFPKRNRIIAGLSAAVVCVEAAERSGSLITARVALEQGREVLAVPGSPLDARAAGCNALIRDGATLVRSTEDVLEALELPLGPSRSGFAEAPAPWTGPEPLPDHLHQMLLGLISSAPVPEDQLIRHAGAAPEQALAALADLDLAGQILRHPGGLVSRAVAPPT